MTHSEMELSQMLNNFNKNFICGIISFPIVSAELVKSIKMLRLRRPLLPVMVYNESPGNIDRENQTLLGNLTVLGVVSPKITSHEILEKIKDKNHNYQQMKSDSGNLDQIDQESTKTDVSFFPVLLKDLLLGPIAYFDIYIRLSSDKYLKLFNKGDLTDQCQLKRYLEKGMEYLYLLRVQQTRFLEYCDSVSENLIKNQNVDPATKGQHVLQLGDQILRNFEEKGVTPDNIKFAQNFLMRGIELLRPIYQSTNENSIFLKKALEDYQHSTAMCILGGMLTRSLGYTSREKINSVSLAIMLHDVGKIKLKPELRHNDTWNFTPEELALYQQHPRISVELFSAVEDIPEIVRQAVLYHHERRDRSGYPQKVSGNSINFVAEIIGLCDEYFLFIELGGEHDDFFVTLDEDLKLQLSSTLIEAFKRTFNKKIN